MKLIVSLFLIVSYGLLSLPSVAAPVNVNTASADEIAAALNGIGKVKAEAIVSYRKENGPYIAPEDLVNVRGVGERTLERIKVDVLLQDSDKSAD